MDLAAKPPPERIVAKEALRALEQMAEQAGFTLPEGDMSSIWPVFKEFTRVHVTDVDRDADGDLLLFEAARLSPRGPNRPGEWYASLLRQFSFTDADGEYLGMDHLRVDLVFANAPRTPPWQPASAIWGAARPPRDPAEPVYESIEPDTNRWIAKVEAHPAFHAALAATPTTVTTQFTATAP